MVTKREKQLAILLLKERLNKLTGKRVVLKESFSDLQNKVLDLADMIVVKYPSLKEKVENIMFNTIDVENIRHMREPQLRQAIKELKDLLNQENSLKEEAALALNNDNYTPIKALEDESDPRPNRMKKPGELPNYWVLMGRNHNGLYIQDECRGMMIDKYGQKGEKVWEGLIEAGTGPFFQFATKVAAEKAWLINELGLQPCHGDYWKYSYFDMWKEWMKRIGQPINIKQPEINIPQTAIKPVVAPVKSIRRSDIKADSKDEMRINDIATKTNNNPIKMQKVAQVMADKITDGQKAYRRGLAAENENYHDLAKIFFNRAKQLGIE